MYNIYTIGNISPKNPIQNIEITDVSIKCGEELIFANAAQNRTIMEQSGYNELFSNHKFNNLDNWKLEITYLENKLEKKEILDIKYKILMRNNEFITKKSESIGYEENEPRIYQKSSSKTDKINNLDELVKSSNYKHCKNRKNCHINSINDKSYQKK